MRRNRRLRRIGLPALVLVAASLGSAGALPAQRSRNEASNAPTRGSYEELVRSDRPIAYWRFDDRQPPATGRTGAGPRPPRFRAFPTKNVALELAGNGEVLSVQDPGARSVFDFGLGDTITLEAWVAPRELGDGLQRYIVGKGRTNRPGFALENQNWSLRLRGEDGTARLSFLFRDEDNRPRGHAEFNADWHRWTSEAAIEIDSGWHHVALSYTFGRAQSLQAWIDGIETVGRWDLGGATDEAPVVDNDEVWIGSSLGGSASSSFVGGIDEVAIYRRALSTEEIRRRVDIDESVSDPRSPAVADPHITLSELAPGVVRAGVFEGIHSRSSWKRDRPIDQFDGFDEPAFAFVGVPHKYSASGVRVDRSNPFLLSASAVCKLPAGQYRFLLRSFSAARLWIDGRLVSSTRFQTRNADGHEAVPDAPAVAHPDLRPLPPGHAEKLVTLDLEDIDGADEHHVRLDAIVGGKGLRPEIGELVTAFSRESGPFVVLSPGEGFPLDDESWVTYRERALGRLEQVSRERRVEASRLADQHWERRHELARKLAGSWRPIEGVDPDRLDASRTVDALIDRRLLNAELKPAPDVGDLAFLRRTSLDTRGTLPTFEEVRAFEKDPSASRRARWVDRLLADRAWADHWVAYWQDVLAENPGILKPKLNNSGPFRWWIHESFLDNKPIDRFVTELVMMEGSKYGGGPRGFELATQNDVPMAAKAHILGTAFLGVEMKCARCHDAPFHPWRQRDLFSVAAMLRRKDQEVPRSSSVPRSKEELDRMLVEVTLQPGSKVPPVWPFAEIAPEAPDPGLIQRPGDPREQLAAIITGPQNRRFAKVIANRLWKRYLGYGLVEPVDDWNDQEASHPALLEFLARELVEHDYDLKHLARVILNSRVYARAPQPDISGGDPNRVPKPEERLFRGPLRRRMTAEQIVDSLFHAVGKPLGSEELNLDVDGRRPVTAFLNLGTPRRAWEFTSLSNERDRPALSMPIAQSITDVLKAFGWRETRQDPITVREESPTVIQPLLIANGTVAHRIATLSDGAAITELSLRGMDLTEFVDAVFLRLLTRRPTDSERAIFVELLEPDFATRLRTPAPKSARRDSRQRAVSWSNHLSAEATRIKLELEAAARAGDPPTERLNTSWRERAEDMVWALINSPEFLFVP